MQVGGPSAITDFPAQLNFTTVTKLPDLVKINCIFGLVVYCQLDIFSCNVTVPGYYHNKTLGMFYCMMIHILFTGELCKYIYF